MSLSNIAEAAGSLLENSVKYRTGVVNDFSIVSKGIFVSVEKDFGGGYKNKKIYPVQINPSEFNRNISYAHSFSVGILNGTDYKKDADKFNSEITIPIIYDIYDEYYIGTSDGLVSTGMLGAGDTPIIGEISLENKNLTSLPALMKLAQANSDTRVLFKWGPIEHFGYITYIDCNYSAFSRWGEPLKCKAEVTMQILRPTQITVNGRTTTDDHGKSAAHDFAVSYSEATYLSNVAALGAMQTAENSGVAAVALQALGEIQSSR